jgi:hypothetical protein
MSTMIGALAMPCELKHFALGSGRSEGIVVASLRVPGVRHDINWGTAFLGGCRGALQGPMSVRSVRCSSW